MVYYNPHTTGLDFIPETSLCICNHWASPKNRQLIQLLGRGSGGVGWCFHLFGLKKHIRKAEIPNLRWAAPKKKIHNIFETKTWTIVDLQKKMTVYSI